MKLKTLTLLMIVLALSACSRSGAQVEEAYETAGDAVDSMDFAMEEAEMAGEIVRQVSANSVSQSKVQQQTAGEGQQRLIIRTGDMSIVVKDTEAAMDAITAMTNSMGGWVVNSNVYESGVAKRGRMTVRIPAGSFDGAMEEIRTDSVEVTDESTSGQDVTEEFVDVSARLANLEATADRVRAFLDETRTVEEALDVNRELSRLEAEIEAMKGRIKYLTESADFSTLSINIIPDALNQPIQVAGWQPQGVARDAIQALINTMQGIGSFLIWFFLYMLPILLIIGLGFYLLRKLSHRLGWKRPKLRRKPKSTE